ncbi:lysine--tRNA ligase [Buchnera aphidicola (Taiwanaphis decaspermi)]|uniref:lysine--tRNA ligase n=1 Tax=Buchnera aphidicola TaxID=9 RepID=UPI0031B87BCE
MKKIKNINSGKTLHEKNNQIKIRKDKLKLIKDNKLTSINNFKRKNISCDIHKKYGNENKKTLEQKKIKVSVAGRIIKKRIIGKVSFLILKDMGGFLQIYLNKKNINFIIYNNVKKLDLGDIIGVYGKLFKTNTNELSIFCKKIFLLTKSIRPLPNKYHGLHNKELCYKQRYLDLISNINTSKIFIARSKIIQKIRMYMNKSKFVEVETAMLQNIPSGANASPFMTYNNSYNTNMFLRISPELQLKQLVIGGFEKVFEINRNFRNEGISYKHNPEFTMMEIYIAYADYKYMMKFIIKLLRFLAKKISEDKIINCNSNILKLNKNFETLTIKSAINKYYPEIKISDMNNIKKLKDFSNKIGLFIDKKWNINNIIIRIFEKHIEKKLINPTFITEYPVEVSTLAKRNVNDPNLADRFEFFINGIEIANGFSELTDSVDQENRFKDQKDNYYSQKTHKYDKDYIKALEYGLPPTAGLGIGIDRLVMFFTNSTNIKDVILFPMIKNN